MSENKKETRGRKPEPEQLVMPDKDTRVFESKDGIKRIWKYDSTITKLGPISCETIYPNSKDDIAQPLLPKNERSSKSGKTIKTLQKYLNPLNNKMVSYTRYKMLVKEGIIKEKG